MTETVTIEKQVWESTLNRSMVLEAENDKLKFENKWYSELLDEAAKDVGYLKELLKEIRGKLHYINTPVNRHNIFSNDFIKKLDQVLGED